MLLIDQLEISVRTLERLKLFYEKQGFKSGETDEHHFLWTWLTDGDYAFRKFMGAKAYYEVAHALARVLLLAIQQYPSVSASKTDSEPPHMRDAFAAVALNGMIANGHGGSEDDLAVCAYQFADAMIKARGK